MSDEERYRAAAHAMQSGVQMEMNWDPASTTPKHLRVGINAALRDHASLIGLLVEKGILTWPEYHKAIADGMEQEVADYEARIAAHYGTEPGKITLG